MLAQEANGLIKYSFSVENQNGICMYVDEKRI